MTNGNQPVETYHEDGQWRNRRQGSTDAFGVSDTKAEAVAMGRETALRDGVEHIIKNIDGTIGERNSYGNDPRRFPG